MWLRDGWCSHSLDCDKAVKKEPLLVLSSCDPSVLSWTSCLFATPCHLQAMLYEHNPLQDFVHIPHTEAEMLDIMFTCQKKNWFSKGMQNILESHKDVRYTWCHPLGPFVLRSSQLPLQGEWSITGCIFPELHPPTCSEPSFIAGV